MNQLPILHVIGDSISMHYGPYLERMLAGVMVYGRKPASTDDPESANGGDSGMVLEYLRQRLSAGAKVNLLLVNCGLHDIRHNHNAEEMQVAPGAYEDNLRAIVVAGRDYGVQVVWVRTTPVVDAVHNTRSSAFFRYARDVARYNAIADKVMSEHGVPSIDLYTFTGNLGPDVYLDHVHFTEPVRAQQAAFIAGRLYSFA